MLRNLHFGASLLLLSACVPEIPEGVLICTPSASPDTGCPPGWACHPNSRCYRDPLANDLEAGVFPGTGVDNDAGDAQTQPARDASDMRDADDEGPIDVDPDTGVPHDSATDAASQPDTAVPLNCRAAASGIDCDDDVFCNGTERCDADDPTSDARGCVKGQPVSCPSGQTCSETRMMCSACSDSKNDSDGDQHQSSDCGGDDCDDADPSKHPGLTEVCDGKDNDCDGNVDGSAADALCMQSAPANGSSRCTSGKCDPKCNDPDFDLVDGMCVKHDDCGTTNPCGAGTCNDGNRDFTCTCPVGYSGTGTKACTDIDECVEPVMHNCDTAPKATCVNKPGGFSCTCPSGTVGDGVGPTGCVRSVNCQDRPRPGCPIEP